ncbi:alpha/beta fold hydrolase BchO [Ahrensia sp. R2A130]|uniref:alpha/beta fold hydrolase BchO n=1 Tax=Ahrensia sp. R2A130 TaxID=744979 RepID=UPI0001E08408|nr:alpha/beta fold hydrolase BchO [Ahrensia sp. R2A130]EFL89062.1 putative magnesium chelatase accessory protein [Ahrensia sp. R2A130]
MDWNRHKRDWPHAEASRFVVLDRQAFHIQELSGPKKAPVVLLLHGSGATTHSYADMMPHLTQHYRVVALDLPGHGFTQPMPDNRPTLPSVARKLVALLEGEDIQPALIVGHSAGAAIAVQMLGHLTEAPSAIISINGAFFPFPGLASHLFPAAAKLLFLNPFVPWAFSFGAGSTHRVEQLLSSTGSKISREGLARYQAALMSRAHVEGALAMMANWDLTDMEERLKSLPIPLHQIIGANDGTISPNAARRAGKLLPQGQIEVVPNTGHLVHEEQPEHVAELILQFATAAA